MSGNKKQTQQQTQNTTSTTTSAAAQAGESFLPQLNNAFAQTQGITYNGDFVASNPNYTGQTIAMPTAPGQQTVQNPNFTGNIKAAPTAAEIQGAGGLAAYGNQQQAPITQAVDNGQKHWNDVLSGKFLDANNNPALQTYLSSIMTNAGINNARAINASRDAAVEGGAYGGTGYGQNMAFMQGEQSRALNDVLAQVSYQNYQDEMARIGLAPGQMAQLSQLGTMPFQWMTQGGQQQRALDQIGIDNNISSFNAGKANEQVALNEAEWQRQEQARMGQIGLDNTRTSYEADAQNRQAGIDNSLFQYQQQMDNIWGPILQYIQALGGLPTTTTTTGSGTTTATTTGGGGNPLSAIIGSALSAYGTYAGNKTPKGGKG